MISMASLEISDSLFSAGVRVTPFRPAVTMRLHQSKMQLWHPLLAPERPYAYLAEGS
jgi:hypothetical protein